MVPTPTAEWQWLFKHWKMRGWNRRRCLFLYFQKRLFFALTLPSPNPLRGLFAGRGHSLPPRERPGMREISSEWRINQIQGETHVQNRTSIWFRHQATAYRVRPGNINGQPRGADLSNYGV